MVMKPYAMSLCGLAGHRNIESSATAENVNRWNRLLTDGAPSHSPKARSMRSNASAGSMSPATTSDVDAGEKNSV